MSYMPTQAALLFYSPDEKFEQIMARIRKIIFESRQQQQQEQPTNDLIEKPPCCAFSNLTHSQWINERESYLDKFGPYSQLDVPPELGVFSANSGMQDASIAEKRDLLADLTLLNAETYHRMKSTSAASPSGDLLSSYLGYVAVNVGLDGLFTKRTPQELIEGYKDEALGKSLGFYQEGELVNDRVLLAGRGQSYPFGRAYQETLLPGDPAS